MKDQRLYAKFTQDFDEHPKIKPLSDAAFRALVEMILYSRRMLTDGYLSKRLAFARWSLDVCQDLLANHPTNPSLIETSDGFLIRDFAEHQTTNGELEAIREVRKAAGRKGGLAKAKQTASKSYSKKLAKRSQSTETETENSLTTNVVRERRDTGKRLPDGWQPPHDVIAQMRADHPHVDLRSEHAKFCDYWHSKTGKDATKCDWAATWRNWIRRAAEQKPRSGLGTTNAEVFSSPKMTTSDRKIAELAERGRRLAKAAQDQQNPRNAITDGA